MIVILFIVVIFFVYYAYNLGKIHGFKEGFDECDRNWDKAFKERMKNYEE
jgi:hypothetical protein